MTAGAENGIAKIVLLLCFLFGVTENTYYSDAKPLVISHRLSEVNLSQFSPEMKTPSSVRKIALQLAVPLLLALIVVNTVFALRNLDRIRQTTEQKLASSRLQANINAIVLDLTNIETGERGFVLTNNPDYLQPFNEAKERLPKDFENLRASLTGRPQEEQALAKEVEKIAQDKADEAAKIIDVRRRLFRKKAFDAIDSNVGKNYMDEARSRLDTLSAAAASSFAQHDRAANASYQEARSTIVLWNLGLLALTALLFVSFRWYTRRLEIAVAQRTAALQQVNVKLESFTSTVSQRIRDLLAGLQTSAEALLHGYGDFLPRQAQQYAEHIQGAAGETNQLLEELVEESHFEQVA